MVEVRDLLVDQRIRWRIGEPVRYRCRRATIVGGGYRPYWVLVDVEGQGVTSVRLDELEAVR